MQATWMTNNVTIRTQGYGRALLRTKRLQRMREIVTEFERHVVAEHKLAIVGSRIVYEPLRNPTDTRLTLKEAIAFHPLHLAQIAAQAGLSEGHLACMARCQYVPHPTLRRHIAEALDTTPEAIRWPAYRVVQEVA